MEQFAVVNCVETQTLGMIYEQICNKEIMIICLLRFGKLSLVCTKKSNPFYQNHVQIIQCIENINKV